MDQTTEQSVNTDKTNKEQLLESLISSGAGPEDGLNLLNHALAPVSAEIELLRTNIIGYIPTMSAASQQITRHVFEKPGKCVRPAMYFLACKMTGYAGEHLIPMAAVTEYVHTASLLHDDVVDSSSLRRNRPTANSVWGDVSSVLVGDLIYARASEMMAESGSLQIVSSYARAIRMMSEGELFQLECFFDAALDEEKYFRIIDCKTAVLIATACQTAGILSGMDQKQCRDLFTFGSAVGTAFQLVDDALDYLGCREIFGKPTQSDLLAGKVTLPVIMLKDMLHAEDLASLKNILAKGRIDRDDLSWVAAKVEQHGTAEKTIERAQAFTDRAMAALQSFPASQAKSDLVQLAETLVWRFN